MLSAVWVNGEVQVWDVFLADGTWLGSRRKFSWAYQLLMKELAHARQT